MRRFVPAALAAATTFGLVTVTSAGTASAADGVFISEIHYDNVGVDTGEAIEVFGPAGTDLTDWRLVLYNGATGLDYDTDPLPSPIPDLAGGFGVVTVRYPQDGVQNGAPDGIALVDNTGDVVEFLSYEGTMTAADGPANALQSTDIGVAESGSTALGESLQLEGCLGDLTWTGPVANTFDSVGLIDTSDDCAAPEPTPVYDWTTLAAGTTVSGPALIESSETTVALPPGTVGHVGIHGEVRFDDGR